MDTVHTLETTSQGGLAGSRVIGFCAIILGAPALVLSGPGTVIALPGSARRMDLPSLVRDNAGSLIVTLQGQSGDAVWLRDSERTVALLRLSQSGVLFVPRSVPIPMQLPYVIPPGGVLNVRLTFGDLGPGVNEQTWYFQGVSATPNGTRVLGTPRVLTIVDSIY